MKKKPESGLLFPLGGPNEAYARFFTGQSYLQKLTGGKRPHRQRHL